MAASKKSKRLVIDASVAQAAGSFKSTHPVGIHCRDFLIQVLDICHDVVISRNISTEWRLNSSNYFWKWRYGMVARNKWFGLEKEQKVASVEDQQLRRTLSGLSMKPKVRSEIMDDLHLIEAALATDGIVVSLDDTVARHLHDMRTSVSQFRQLIWINPTREPDKCITWLQQGAKKQQAKREGLSLI